MIEIFFIELLIICLFLLKEINQKKMVQKETEMESKEWCEHIRITSSGWKIRLTNESEDTGILVETVAEYMKFCLVCGKPRPEEKKKLLYEILHAVDDKRVFGNEKEKLAAFSKAAIEAVIKVHREWCDSIIPKPATFPDYLRKELLNE